MLYCVIFPVLEPYCWGCHDSEPQLVTRGAYKSPRLCSPSFIRMHAIGHCPGNHRPDAVQEVNQPSYWRLWNFHSIISQVVCLWCFSYSLSPASLIFFFSSGPMPVFYIFIIIMIIISLICVSYLQPPKHFNPYGIWSMCIEKPFYSHFYKERQWSLERFSDVSEVIQVGSGRTRTDPIFLLFLSSAFSCMWGSNQTFQLSLIPLNTFKSLEVTKISWSI